MPPARTAGGPWAGVCQWAGRHPRWREARDQVAAHALQLRTSQETGFRGGRPGTRPPLAGRRPRGRPASGPPSGGAAPISTAPRRLTPRRSAPRRSAPARSAPRRSMGPRRFRTSGPARETAPARARSLALPRSARSLARRRDVDNHQALGGQLREGLDAVPDRAQLRMQWSGGCQPQGLVQVPQELVELAHDRERVEHRAGRPGRRPPVDACERHLRQAPPGPEAVVGHTARHALVTEPGVDRASEARCQVRARLSGRLVDGEVRRPGKGERDAAQASTAGAVRPELDDRPSLLSGHAIARRARTDSTADHRACRTLHRRPAGRQRRTKGTRHGRSGPVGPSGRDRWLCRTPWLPEMLGTVED